MKNTPSKVEQKVEHSTTSVPLFRSTVPLWNTLEQDRARYGNIMIISGTLFQRSGTRPSLCHHPRFLERGGVEQQSTTPHSVPE
jgi:hypothetical protein